MDYVEIHERDPGGPLIGRYCGNSIPNNVTAAHKVWIKFRSDSQSTGGAGFMAHYGLVHGSELNGTFGLIESPGYPHNYIGSEEFVWKVIVPANKYISVRFLSMNIGTFSENSCSGYVEIFDGYGIDNPLLRQFCGYQIPEPIGSHGSQITIRFQGSDYLPSSWSLQWNTVDEISIVLPTPPESTCWQELNVNVSQEITITSPGYPNGYTMPLNCTWVLRTAHHNHFKLNFTDVNIKGYQKYCYSDKIEVYSAPNPNVDYWELLDTFCGRNQNYTIQVRSSLLKVIFTTRDEYYSLPGFELKATTECGGNMVGSSGVLRSVDLVPYIANINRYSTYQCNWTIIVGQRRTIQITFDQFNFPSDNVCSNSHILLLNGGHSTSPYLGNGKYCGTTIPTVGESVSNQVFVMLTVKNMYAHGYPSFVLRFREVSAQCSRRIYLTAEKTSEVIMSPNHPSPPPHEIDCIWVIMSPSGTKMRLDFEEEFDMDPDCHWKEGGEYVEAMDGGTELSSPLGKFCGSDHPSSVQTTGNVLMVHYVAAVEHPKGGFKATVHIAECGGTIVDYYGIISTPHFPQNYTSALECVWTLKVMDLYTISVQLLELDTPYNRNCSASDYVEIRDENSSGALKARYCGNMPNGSTALEMSGPTAYVKFKSDSSRTGRGFRLKFAIIYGDACGGSLTEPSGVIESPNYPEAHPRPRYCWWSITAPPGRRVTLTFTALNLRQDETTGICIDRINIYNQTLIQFGQYGHFLHLCGNVAPQTVESSTNVLRLYFLTRGLVAGQGFSLTYTTDKEAMCGSLLTLPSGSIATPQFSFGSNLTAHCDWQFETGQQEDNNRTVAITFDVLDIAGHASNYCREGLLLFRRVQYSYPSILRWMCGNFSGQNLRLSSPYSSSLLSLSALLQNPFLGLNATYKVQECGGLINGVDAVITSPGYPNNYTTNVDCHWILKLEDWSSQITLTTVDMKLEDDCDNDYVLVLNGYHLNSPQVGRFCGTRNPVPITSQYNTLTIIFHSNGFGSAPGFKMTTQAVESGCGGLIHTRRGTIQSENYSSNTRYKNNIECEWTIEFPAGYLVNLTFVGRFDIEMSESCVNDYLMIEDYDNGAWLPGEKKCGSELPQPIVSKSTKMRITFSTNDQIQGDGFQINYASGCGGHFTDSEGSFISPNYPNLYDDNLYCSYIIGDLQSYGRLEFDTSSFSIEDHDECIYDNVTIYEGNSTSGANLGSYCGTNAPGPFRSVGQLLVVFQTDYAFRTHGFLANYKISHCGGNLTGPSGTFRSPTHPERYFNNMDCTWIITVQPNTIIQLQFLSFQMEPSYGCYYDWIEIWDGNSTSGTSFGRLCGYEVQPIIKSSSNQITVHFRTDSSVTMDGFVAAYRSTFGVAQGCGGTIIESSGEIKSLDHDKDGNYEPNLDCSWVIIGNDEQVVNMTFQSFDIEAAANGSCIYDYLEVKDGIEKDDPVIGRYCGRTPPLAVISSTNKMVVHFHSDGKENKPGFSARFNSVPTLCGPSTFIVSNVSRTLTSPGFPSAYPPNLYCRWHFFLNNTYSSERVHLSFTEVDVPCGGDYVEVKSEERRNYYYRQQTSASRHCGSNILHDVITTHGVWLSFHSDSSGSGRGFNLTYKTAECNFTYTKGYGVIVNPGFPYQYANYDNCYTLVETSPDRTISLYFSTFSIANYRRDNCSQMSLRVYDGRNSSANLLANICGYVLPNPIFSTGHQLWIHARLEYSYATYFISYTTSDKGRGCGGTLSDTKGTFTSPLYPAAYNRSTPCIWYISVPGYHTMELLFDFFSLNSTAGCNTNYLEIYEGNTETPDKRISRLCGDDDPAPYTSQGNQLLVKLVTNSTNSAAGFVARFIMNEMNEHKSLSVLEFSPTAGPSTTVVDGVLYMD